MLYKPDNIKNLSYERDLGDPGEYPFTRGVHPSMYSGRLWTMRQYAGYGTAEESNQRYRYLLKQGQTGLSVAFDLPTQMGYDSDHPMAEGEVGRTGVAIDTLDDMRSLFKEIPLDRVSASMTINATASIILAMYIAAAEERGIDISSLEGTVQNDVLKEYFARGAYIYPPVASLDLIVDLMSYCGAHLPKWNTISISGYHIREAGATASQEIAFTLANGAAYVNAAINIANIPVDSFAPRLSFFFNAHNDFLEEVAKFRAARRLWAKIMKEQFHAVDPRSWMLRFHTQTAGCTLTAQEPDNNIVRVALQALSAVLGGTQSLHTNSRDEALALPTEDSVKLALRTQQIIAYESGIPKVTDPLAGSYCIESLTSRIVDEATSYLNEIDEMGGAIAAIEQGYFQKAIHQSAYDYQKKVEKGETIVLGVNKFATDQPPRYALLKVAPELVRKQRQKLAAIKKNRGPKRVQSTLSALKDAAKSHAGMMAKMIECVRAYATLGEISDALREVYGEYREKNIF